MVFADPASQNLAKLLGRISLSDVPVMISGEVGTGKEIVARYIHEMSGRPGSFLAVNCSSIADRLAERGQLDAAAAAGTSVSARSERWFEAARHGTLFLDEVADLPPGLQSQLLRILQDHETKHGEAHDTEPADVRIVAATKVDLSEAVSGGRFRLDLFYRLNIGQVRLLPLRQRRGDVAALAGHFLRTYGKRLHLSLPLLTQEAVAALTDYAWPGNVRELENVIRFAVLAAPGQELRTEHLKLDGVVATTHAPAIPPRQEGVELPQALSKLLVQMFQAPRERLFDDLEKQVIAEAFRFTGCNQVRTAALLGISRNVVRTLLRKHGLLVIQRRKPNGNTASG